MLSLHHLCQSSLHSSLLHSHLLSSTRGSRGAVLTLPVPPGSVMCCVWVSHQLQPCATAGLSALVLQSSRCLGFTGCTCTWVCGSGCLLCAWGGAGLAQKEWMGGPGAAAAVCEGTVGADCPRYHTGKHTLPHSSKFSIFWICKSPG